MSNEIEVKKATKIKKGYIVFALVVILAAIGVMIGNGTKEENTTNTSTQITTEQDSVTKQIAIIEESPVARIEFSTKLVDAQKPQFEIYVNDSKTPEQQVNWMPNLGDQGYVVQSDNGKADIVIKSPKDVDISLNFRGKWEQDKEGKLVKNWVKYTSVTINGEEILSKSVNVWHQNPFTYTLNAKAGKTYKIHAEWTKVDTVPEK